MTVEKILKKAEGIRGFLDYLKDEPEIISKQKIIRNVFKNEINNSGTVEQIIFLLIEKNYGIKTGYCESLRYSSRDYTVYCSKLRNRPRCGLIDEICTVNDGMD